MMRFLWLMTLTSLCTVHSEASGLNNFCSAHARGENRGATLLTIGRQLNSPLTQRREESGLKSQLDSP